MLPLSVNLCEMSVKDLVLYGFENVGKWKLENDGKINFEKEESSESRSLWDERVIYAFVVDNNVVYIGVCDDKKTTLEQRMKRYKYKQGGGTNERIVNEIKKLLNAGKGVYIYASKPIEQIQLIYRGLDIDLIKGLETPLIEKFSPEWNKRGKDYD